MWPPGTLSAGPPAFEAMFSSNRNNSGTLRARIMLLCAALAGASAATAQSDLHPYLTSDWWVDAGVYYPNRRFTASLDGTLNGDNEEIEFGRDFGLRDREGIFNAEIGWMFGEKWGTSVQYFESERVGSRVIDEEIEWDDVVYEVGADITATTELDITRIVAFRRFREKGGHDLRLVAGIHWLDISAGLAGEARLDDNTTEFTSRTAAASAPLPNIGAWYRYSPSNKWVLSARVDWLEASIGDYRGRIINATAGVGFAFTDHFGIGLRYQHFSLGASVNNETWRGDVEIDYGGPILHLSGYW